MYLWPWLVGIFLCSCLNMTFFTQSRDLATVLTLLVGSLRVRTLYVSLDGWLLSSIRRMTGVVPGCLSFAAFLESIGQWTLEVYGFYGTSWRCYLYWRRRWPNVFILSRMKWNNIRFVIRSGNLFGRLVHVEVGGDLDSALARRVWEACLVHSQRIGWVFGGWILQIVSNSFSTAVLEKIGRTFWPSAFLLDLELAQRMRYL